MGQVRRGTLRLLYVAPERFNNERFREAITSVRIALCAVDEAHCISEWGHNFRPDYLKLAGFARACGAERILALTATATERVFADICDGLAIDAERANPPGPTIVYVTLQRTAEALAERLAAAGFEARALSRGDAGRAAGRDPGPVHGLGPGHRGRHHRLRHWHRQGEYPPCLSLQPAQEPGELFPGDQARRPRRRAGNLSHVGMPGRPERA